MADAAFGSVTSLSSCGVCDRCELSNGSQRMDCSLVSAFVRVEQSSFMAHAPRPLCFEFTPRLSLKRKLVFAVGIGCGITAAEYFASLADSAKFRLRHITNLAASTLAASITALGWVIGGGRGL